MGDFGVYAVALVVIAFGAIGYTRGWHRETVALASLVVAWALVLVGGRVLVSTVDRFHLWLTFAFRGGLDRLDTTSLMQELRDRPLVDPSHPEPLYALLFLVAVVVGYGLAVRWVRNADRGTAQVLGAAIGLINGYLLSCALLRFGAPPLFGSSMVATSELVGQYAVPVVLLGGAVVAGILAAKQLRHGGRRGKPYRPARSAKARGR